MTFEESHNAVRTAIENAPVYEPGSVSWQPPLPTGASLSCSPYPLDALPPVMREAVEEVQSFIRAPMAMVATSALSSLSLAAQGHFDVQRAERLEGPVSLNTLVIAESGERKTSLDKIFNQGLEEWQNQERKRLEPEIKKFEAAQMIWEAKVDGLKAEIKSLVRKGEPSLEEENRLEKLQQKKPKSPLVPRLYYADTTPEALGYGLVHHWPSAGLISSEAGTFFGGHGMRQDSTMRNLSFLNQLWDGKAVPIDRRTSESFIVQGVRLTVSLQVQEAALRAFMEREGELARGIGFLARFLVAWPESTQGQRFFIEAPKQWIHLDRFNARLRALIARPVPLNPDGSLSPNILAFLPQAKSDWIAAHDLIERELRLVGELEDVRDVAAKAADNIARIAALFRILDASGETAHQIAAQHVESAVQLVSWHLNESRRFLGQFSQPHGIARATLLMNWILKWCRTHRTDTLMKTQVMNSGPASLRRKSDLEPVLQHLQEQNYLKVYQDQERWHIRVHPALLQEVVHHDA